MRLLDYIRAWRAKRRPAMIVYPIDPIPDPPPPNPLYGLKIAAVRVGGSAWSRMDISRQIADAQRIWSSAMIRPWYADHTDDELHAHWRVINDGQKDFFEIHTDAERRYREQGVCAVYFVDEVWLGNTQVIAQGSKPSAPGIYAHGIWIGRWQATPWSLAHELGHYLGLGDVYDAGSCRVMHGRMSASSPIMSAECYGQRLTWEEIMTARRVCQEPLRSRVANVIGRDD